MSDEEQAGTGPPGDGEESIADLIDEASRTAAEQAEQEAAGAGHEDRSADVWGDADEVQDVTEDPDAIWASAEAASEDSADHDGWTDGEDWGAGDDADEVWSADDEDAAAIHDAEPIDPSRPPAAAEGMAAERASDEPDTFTFPIGADDEAPPLPARPAVEDDPEPEPFQFEAGPATTAPMPVRDEPPSDEPEPEAFTFAVDEDTGPVMADPAPRGDEHEDAPTPESSWAVATDAPADGEGEAADSDIWTFDVSTQTENGGAATEAASLAEAEPRAGAGWRDLEAEQQPAWDVPDLPPRHYDDDDDDDDGPMTFLVGEPDDEPAAGATPLTGTPDGGAPDEPTAAAPAGTAPAGERPRVPADVATAEVHSALGELLGNDEDVGEMLDDLSELDLDQFDDLSAESSGTEDEASYDEDGYDDMYDDELEDDELDAPTAARQVMEPGKVTFSSRGKKKKRRGWFG